MAPNLHQTRLNALSNSLVGREILQHAKDAVAPSTPTVDSASYWEWRSDPDPALFSSSRMVELILQQRERKSPVEEESQTVAEHDDYWAEARFPAERAQPVTPSCRPKPSVATTPQYWDEATHTQSLVDEYWKW
jgi:hypothetical protein